MPLQSPPRKVSETENMLRLLLCVDALGSATPVQLWTFAAEQELMDYVTMRLCLHKLLSAGEIETGEGALKEQLFVTDRGREALSLFGQRVPGDIRKRVRQAAPEFHGRMERNQQVRAVYEMARPDDYRLNLSVCEGDLPTIRLHMETTNRSLASRAIHRFAIYAAETTTYLYGLAEQAAAVPADADSADGKLSDGNAANTQGAADTQGRKAAGSPEGVTDAATGESIPLVPQEAIVEHSATEFSASVTIKGKKVRFGVELLLPSRRSAEAFIRALTPPDAAAQAADRLARLISGAGRRTKR